MPRLLLRAFLLCTLLSIASLYIFSSSSTSLRLRLRLRLHSTTFHFPSQNLALHQVHPPPPQPSAAILLPDFELLLLVPRHRHHRPLRCLFDSGATSPASHAGVLPWSSRPLLRCPVPDSLRRKKLLISPRLINPEHEPDPESSPRTETIRWSLLVYESTSTPTDVLVFAKGVNNRQGIDTSPSDLRCVFYQDNSSIYRTTVTSSAQEVFRCRHPDDTLLSSSEVKVSLEVDGKVLPSIAQYTPPPPVHDKGDTQVTSLICSCTMVHNVAKFLSEWVTYHSRVGVDRFILYDNGSEDGLDQVVTRLNEEGQNVTTYLWPWPKTQEAGFSHAAVVHRDSCTWMMYLDVDEFVYSPSWVNSAKPKPNMLRSILPPESDQVGQVMIDCRDFGPSGLRQHPVDGVTQGYTCRMKVEERHKSLVRLDSIDDSLRNVVHHFKLKKGYGVKRLSTRQAVVNHYKYQAWPEFRNKFKRRVSAYVVDWMRASNAASKDRTPGLGFEAVEPEDWPKRFCEVSDTLLKELTRRWFGRAGPARLTGMAWEKR